MQFRIKSLIGPARFGWVKFAKNLVAWRNVQRSLGHVSATFSEQRPFSRMFWGFPQAVIAFQVDAYILIPQQWNATAIRPTLLTDAPTLRGQPSGCRENPMKIWPYR